MKMNLRGQTALVTGSTSGIGLHVAEELANNGCNIVLNGFGEQSVIEELQTRLQVDFGVSVLYIPADLSDVSECRDLAEKAKARFRDIGILVNNAGIQHVAPVEDFPIDRWGAILAINLSAAFHLAAALLPGMRAQGFGRIVNIASVHGLVGSKYKSAYVAAKHGLIGLTKVIALETAGQGITCNAICPGYVMTSIVEAQVEKRTEKEGVDRRTAEQILLNEGQPSGEFIRSEDIGALTVFLCSSSAAGITGASLPMDGGWSAR
jgi:3-hydroxybutyrate dehydrogenase